MPRTKKPISLSGDVIKWDFTPDEKKEWKREQAKKKRLADMKKTTFSYLPLPEGAEPITAEGIKAGDFIVRKDPIYFMFRYFRIVKVNPKTGKITYIECDENGVELVTNNARSQAFIRNWEKDVKEGNGIGLLPKPGKVAKAKIIGTETIQGITINIFDHADEDAKRGRFGFTKDHYDYYRILGHGWGYTKVKDVFNPNTSDEKIKEELLRFTDIAIGHGHLSNLYLDNPAHAEAAKNLRAMLKNRFPDTTFSVSTNSYYNCYVSYKDGPTEASVDDVAGRFEEIYESDPYSDYGNFWRTSFTAIFGGFHNVKIEREISKEHRDKLIEVIPELKNGGEPEKYNLDFDKIKKGLKEKFGYEPKSWDDLTRRSYITINSVLAHVRLDKTEADKTPKKRPQSTPTEKLISKAIGSGNILIQFGDVHGLCKKDKEYGYVEIFHSQDSVYKTVKERIEAAGLKMSDKLVNGCSIVVSNYDEFKRKIEQERREFGIPTPPSQEAYARLKDICHKISMRNSNKRYDIEWKKKYQR